MTTYVLALNPTDSLTEGFLPAAQRLGLDVVLLTDQPDAHRAAYAGTALRSVEVRDCDVRDAAAAIAHVAAAGGRPSAVFSNSDHLQTSTALAAAFFGLPGKDWRATLRTKNKGLTRAHLAAAGLDTVFSHVVEPAADLDALTSLDAPYPCVVKPREGVASEDVVLVGDAVELVARAAEIRERRRGQALVVEEYLDGPLHTLETLGDGTSLRVLGGFHTRLSPPPYFVEERLDWRPDLPEPVVASVLAQLDALGVGFGACHTELVVQGDRARLVEVNYRIIGDRCDLLLADLLGEDLFAEVLRVHHGEPLTPAPADRPRRFARIEWVYAREAGVLGAAPPACAQEGKGALAYHPLRTVGEHVPLTNTNRDYLGVVRAVGDDESAVDRAVEDFLASHTWDVRP